MTSRNILVVEDHAVTREPLARLLRYEGFSTTCAANGVEALHAATSARPDLVLLDIMMPHMSGLDVLAELRQIPHRRSTPVIMLTAKGHETDRAQAASLGATDFLTKPFSPKKLLARIEEVFYA